MKINLDMLSELREDAYLEAKGAAKGFPKSFWESYAAMANTDGGTILLGVSEGEGGRLTATGVYDVLDAQRRLWNNVNNPSKVSANVLTESDVEVREISGRDVLIVRVPRAPRQQRPIFINANPLTGTFRRNGEGDYRCSKDEYEAMVRDASPTGMDGTPLAEHELASLCADTVTAYRNLLSSTRPDHPWLSLSDEELLLRLGAAARTPRDGKLHPTRAGLLCFGYEYEIVREFPGYSLDFRDQSSPSAERWSDRVVSNDGMWSGNVFDFWRMVSSRLGGMVRRPFSLDGRMLRVDDSAMHRAVREGLVNALVHADYLGRRGTIVVAYGDRVEFANPGTSLVALPVALSGGISETRNPTMLKLFGLVNACEKAGSGLDAIQAACAAAHAKAPVLREEFSPDRTLLTIHLGDAAIADTTQQTTGAQASRASMDPDELRVLDAFAAADGPLSRTDVQQMLNCGSTKAKRLLTALVKRGAVQIVGSGNRTAYRLSS